LQKIAMCARGLRSSRHQKDSPPAKSPPQVTSPPTTLPPGEVIPANNNFMFGGGMTSNGGELMVAR